MKYFFKLAFYFTILFLWMAWSIAIGMSIVHWIYHGADLLNVILVCSSPFYLSAAVTVIPPIVEKIKNMI